jgi:hypothetical protein
MHFTDCYALIRAANPNNNLIAFLFPKSSICRMPELDKDIEAYKRLQPELETHHNGKWVVINSGEMFGVFDSFEVAAGEAVNRFGRGPYLIRQVGASDFVMPASVMYRLSPQNA